MQNRRFPRQPTSAREIELLVQGRVPPHDLDAEACCISSAILHQPARALLRDVLEPAACYSDANRMVLDVIYELDEAASGVDVVTIKDALRANGLLEKVGGMEYLMLLTDATPAVKHVLDHAAIVVDAHQQRLAISAIWLLLAEAYNAPRPASTWRERAAETLTTIAELGGQPSGGALRDGLAASHTKLLASQKGEGQLTGIPTGFIELDRQTGGLSAPDILLVCGVEGRGKSTFAHCLAAHVASTPEVRGVNARDERVPRGVVIFSVDNMDRALVAHRLACARGRVDSTVFRNGSATPRDWDRLTRASSELEELPIHIEDDTTLTPLRMRSRLRTAKASLHKQFGADLAVVVLDYVQLMRLDGDQEHLSDEQRLNRIGKALLRIAKDFNVVLVVLSQINADGTTSHARSLQQDAQNKVTIDWKYSKPRVALPGIDPKRHGCTATIDVQKWRNGKTGKIHTLFYPAFTLFTDEVL